MNYREWCRHNGYTNKEELRERCYIDGKSQEYFEDLQEQLEEEYEEYCEIEDITPEYE